jgi:hypothetical protein
MHKPIAPKSVYARKEIEPELEATVKPIISDRSPNAPNKRPFPWRMLLTLIIGLPAAVFGLLVGGFGLLMLVFGGTGALDCGGGGSNSAPEKPSTSQPAAKPAQPTSPRS